MDSAVREETSTHSRALSKLIPSIRKGWVFGLACLLLQGLSLSAAQLTLTADAHVNSAMPDVNSGTISNLDVGGGYNAYLQFDVSALPPGTTASKISRALLRLYANRVTAAGGVSIAPATALWGEYSITFSNQPATGPAVVSATVSSADQFVTVDVTSLVQGWVTTPSSNFGVALTAATAVVQFDSKENDITSHSPALEVDLVDVGPQGPAGPPGAVGPTGATGQAGSSGPVGPQGPQGPAGVQGAAGPAGPKGDTGAVGPSGPAGPAGPAGATGAIGPAGAGIAYRGAYQPTVNYAAGEVVLWQGSSYISLQAANHGNSPAASPAFWGLLSAQGPAGAAGPVGTSGAQGPQGLPGSMGPSGPMGPAGPQGLPGQAGAQGIPGLTGAVGPQGPVGAPGSAGPVGMSFQGQYQSGVNYALGDGVSYQGSGYVSRVAGNRGNTPDQSPAQWTLFAAAGVAGAPGAAGPQGPQGPAGATGPVGPAGAAGQNGIAGPQGPAVANYTGNYQSSASYQFHDAVSWQGSTWISLAASNRSNTPDQSPAWWALLAAQGPAGPAGAQGPAGAPGVAGLPGLTGPAGPQGPAAVFLGPWDSARTYNTGEAVSYEGSSYIALLPNTGREPDLGPQVWGLLAAAGLPGATGAAGAQGPMGYAGPAGAPGTPGSTGPAGPQGAQGPPVTFLGSYSPTANYTIGDTVAWQGSSYISLIPGNRGNAPDQVSSAWALLAARGSAGPVGSPGIAGPIGPQGAAGSVGPAGPPGTPGLNFRGPWLAGSGYAANDAVTFNGSSYIAQMNNSSSEPDIYPQAWSMLAAAGSVGPSGPSGSAATVSIGTVTTGQPGTQASVTNSGTSSAAVLNFVIPQGATGTSTSSTGSGAGTLSFAATYHAVSYTSTYFSVNNTNSASTETATVLAWIPNACTVSQLSIYSQQSNTIVVTLRSGTPGAMSSTALSCSVSSGTSCNVTGSIPVPAGSFLDFSITGSSGNPAGVWTSVTCQ